MPSHAGAHRPLLIALHGFTHDGSTWDAFAGAVTERRVLAPDLRGHGRDTRTGTLGDAAADVLALAASDGADRFDLLGYSMGGRVALHAALAAPARVRTLTLVGADPGIREPAARTERRRRDDALAAELRSRGLEAFAASWEQQAMFAGLARRPAVERERLASVRRSHDADALASVLASMSPGRQDDLWPELARLDVPVLAVAGADDVKYAGIAEEIRRCAPQGAAGVVSGCGHAVHLEAPTAFAALVREWLTAHPA